MYGIAEEKDRFKAAIETFHWDLRDQSEKGALGKKYKDKVVLIDCAATAKVR